MFGYLLRSSVESAPLLVPRAPTASTRAPPPGWTLLAQAGGLPQAPAQAPSPVLTQPKTEAESAEQTAAYYPDDAKVAAAFNRFTAAELKKIQDPAERRQFLTRMSLYLGPHPATENHFAKIRKVRIAGDHWLHDLAASRLEAVDAALEAKNHPMPLSGVTFGLRGLWKGPVASKGKMVHAMGFALDYRAVTNPHITDQRLVDLQSIFVRDAMRIDVGEMRERNRIISRMGRREATSKEIENFEARFRGRYAAAVAGSEAMKAILPEESVQALRRLGAAYKDYLAKERRHARRSRQKKLPEAVREGLEQERGALNREKEDISFETWLTLLPVMLHVDEVREAYLAANPGIAELPSSEEIERMAASTRKAIKPLSNEARRSEQALARANRTLASLRRSLDLAAKAKEDAAAALEKALNGRDAARLGRKRDQAQAAYAKAQEKLRGAEQAVKEATAALAAATEALKEAQREADEWKERAGRLPQVKWAERLERLRLSLAMDLDFVLKGKRDVQDPSVAQLLEKGYFNPDLPGGKQKGFDETFMLEMAHHGFTQGAEWEPGSVDSMHFQLVESVETLRQPEEADKKKNKKKP